MKSSAFKPLFRWESSKKKLRPYEIATVVTADRMARAATPRRRGAIPMARHTAAKSAGQYVATNAHATVYPT